MNNTQRNCGHCHTCGRLLHRVLDGEEYCATCQTYRRYISHGWNSTCDPSPCPDRCEICGRPLDSQALCVNCETRAAQEFEAQRHGPKAGGLL